jgi:transcriptional regulator with XRE-family HTH domain
MKERHSLDPTTFGAWLKSEIKAQNLTYKRLATMAGCHHTTIGAIVRGRIPTPSVAMMTRLQNALGQETSAAVKQNVETSSSFEGKAEIFTDFNPFDDESIPDTAGVYVLYGPTDVVLYVGQSKNVRKRIAQHREKSGSFLRSSTLESASTPKTKWNVKGLRPS